MRKFHELGIAEVRIIDYLIKTDYAEVTYTELTEAIGLDKKMVSNVRKAAIRLQELGIICIKCKYRDGECKARSNPMKGCYMDDNWMDNLLNGGVEEV
jgi:DNA-binding Xre family transcriptional regulator